ncbi:MAG: hypothetical protein AAFV88_25725 [Planctomycetota bacterium]
MFKKGYNPTLPLQFFTDASKLIQQSKQQSSGSGNVPLGMFENDGALYIKVKNTTAKPMRRFAIVGLGQMVIESTAAMQEPIFEAVAPEDNPLRTPIALCESIPAGKTGKAVIRGIAPALVNFTAGDDHVRMAEPDPSPTKYGPQDSTTDPTSIEIVHGASGTISMVLLKPLADGWIFRTPVGGIPARSGNACGSALCDAYWINNDGDLEAITGIQKTVWNLADGASGGVSAETYIQAKTAATRLVADVDYCPAT